MLPEHVDNYLDLHSYKDHPYTFSDFLKKLIRIVPGAAKPVNQNCINLLPHRLIKRMPEIASEVFHNVLRFVSECHEVLTPVWLVCWWHAHSHIPFLFILSLFSSFSLFSLFPFSHICLCDTSLFINLKFLGNTHLLLLGIGGSKGRGPGGPCPPPTKA